ncbi:hypothetical protein OGATHE_000604 [Ogataea polymorpha]|uniref:Uncharacterized protein n=1 Tax=Ogataea polymorpha TaxID=460523 RepID=A0A9P8PV46_9ASCO|nr:hypothetical protein OGATHE_000604 [Ogataea polymorpha]
MPNFSIRPTEPVVIFLPKVEVLKNVQRSPNVCTYLKSPLNGNTVTNLDSVGNLTVLLVGLVVLVGHHPLVNSENSTRLQHLVDLAIHPFKHRSMDGGLN